MKIVFKHLRKMSFQPCTFENKDTGTISNSFCEENVTLISKILTDHRKKKRHHRKRHHRKRESQNHIPHEHRHKNFVRIYYQMKSNKYTKKIHYGYVEVYPGNSRLKTSINVIHHVNKIKNKTIRLLKWIRKSIWK